MDKKNRNKWTNKFREMGKKKVPDKILLIFTKK